MIPQSGGRFADKIMPKQKGMIPQSRNPFAGEIVPKLKGTG